MSDRDRLLTRMRIHYDGFWYQIARLALVLTFTVYALVMLLKGW